LSFPETLFKSERVQDPMLGNTSILSVDSESLKRKVQKFNDGEWPEPDGNLPDPINP